MKTAKKTSTRKVSISKLGFFKEGTYGVTTDYSLLKKFVDNRGIKDGVDRLRINKHKEDIKNDMYIDLGYDVLTNKHKEICDGHHRFVAKSELGLPIRYYVTTDKELNSDDPKERFVRISYLNSHNPQWTKGNTYKASINKGLPLAERIEVLIDILSGETGLEAGKIKVSWLFSLLKKDVKYFNNSKELNTASVYNDKALTKYSKTEEFTMDFENFTELIKIFSNKFTRFNNITKYILDLYWNNSNFDLNSMLINLNKYRFELPDNFKANDIKLEIERVYNVRKSYRNYTKLF